MISSIFDLSHVVKTALQKYSGKRLFTVAISGIDGSGKGYIAAKLQQLLESDGYNVANINIDPWQQPIPVRLQKENPAENFYLHVFRWQDFFNQLVLPLQNTRSIYLEARLIRTDADVYYNHTYDYAHIDILLLEGILLFQEQYEPYYDLKIWIDCTFEEALKRAINRNVEELEEDKLRQDYETYYYAAQMLHFRKDHPQQRADIIFDHKKML